MFRVFFSFLLRALQYATEYMFEVLSNMNRSLILYSVFVRQENKTLQVETISSEKSLIFTWTE